MKSGAAKKNKKKNENRGVKGILQGTDAHQGEASGVWPAAGA